MDMIRKGVPITTAAQASGICRATFYVWKSRGEVSKTGIYRKFVIELAKAQADAEALFVSRMWQHSKADGHTGYQATAWMLERRFPDRWSRRQVIETTAAPTALQTASDEDIQAELEALGLADTDPPDDAE